MRRGFLLLAGGLMLFVAGVLFTTTNDAFGLVDVTPYEADVNKNGQVNSGDLMLVAQRFGQGWTATPTSTPAPTPVPNPFEIITSGPAVTLPGVEIAYTFVVRNAGVEPAMVDLNYLIASEAFAPNCVQAGQTDIGPQGGGPCSDLSTFQANGFHATVAPGEAAWVTMKGWHMGAYPDSPQLQQMTWHFTNSSVSASGNALVSTNVRTTCPDVGC